MTWVGMTAARTGDGRGMALILVTFRFVGIAILGIACATAVALLPSIGIKAMVALAAGGAAIALAIWLGRPLEVLLAAYIAALSYNRQYFSFDDLLGASGTSGLYWMIADPVLALLLLVSLTVPDRGTPAGQARLGVTPILPFLAVCVISTLFALRPDWAANDTYRVLKFAILLAWLHRNMTPSLWLTAVTTLGAVATLQILLGIAQVALKGEASLLAMAGLATQTGGVETEIENRARGTLGHPNMFAPYLLMMIPAAFGLALFARGRLLSLVGLAITALGVIGIFVSKSRAPVALLGLALVAVAIAAVQLRALSVRAFLGTAILLTALGAAATIPFLDQIIERIGGDFASSISFRSDFNTAATLIWSDHPIWGIGPNNLNLELGRHFPMLAALIQESEAFRDVGNARSPTVHNVYFLMLAETGLIGLVSFLYLLASALSRTIRSAAATTGAVRGLCVGLAIGFAAQYLQQLVDFSLWYDSCRFTFAILIALAGTAPRCAPQAAQDEAPKGAPKGATGQYQTVMVWP